MEQGSCEQLVAEAHNNLQLLLRDTLKRKYSRWSHILKATQTADTRPWVTISVSDDPNLSVFKIRNTAHPFREMLYEIFKEITTHPEWHTQATRLLTKLAADYHSPHFIVLDVEFVPKISHASQAARLTREDRSFLKAMGISSRNVIPKR